MGIQQYRSSRLRFGPRNIIANIMAHLGNLDKLLAYCPRDRRMLTPISRAIMRRQEICLAFVLGNLQHQRL